MALTQDELCQIACRFLQNNCLKVAFHERFAAVVSTGEQPDAIGFRNLASCLIEVKCSRADFWGTGKNTSGLKRRKAWATGDFVWLNLA
ncbi:Uncharacterised protein [Klebsiella variicola]|nr:Uncharacterised protein [Klebsiella variicola]